MARPRKNRRVCALPNIAELIPDVHSEEVVEMTVDEYETIRLIDYLGCSQEECALQMNVARTTVQAIYDSARQKLAEVLVCGRKLKISGGAYELCAASKCCSQKNHKKHCCPFELYEKDGPHCAECCGFCNKREKTI